MFHPPTRVGGGLAAKVRVSDKRKLSKIFPAWFVMESINDVRTRSPRTRIQDVALFKKQEYIYQDHIAVRESFPGFRQQIAKGGDTVRTEAYARAAREPQSSTRMSKSFHLTGLLARNFGGKVGFEALPIAAGQLMTHTDLHQLQCGHESDNGPRQMTPKNVVSYAILGAIRKENCTSKGLQDIFLILHKGPSTIMSPLSQSRSS